MLHLNHPGAEDTAGGLAHAGLEFNDEIGFPTRHGFRQPIDLIIESSRTIALEFQPGSGWAALGRQDRHEIGLLDRGMVHLAQFTGENHRAARVPPPDWGCRAGPRSAGSWEVSPRRGRHSLPSSTSAVFPGLCPFVAVLRSRGKLHVRIPGKCVNMVTSRLRVGNIHDRMALNNRKLWRSPNGPSTYNHEVERASASRTVAPAGY